MSKKKAAVIMGSDSDWPVVEKAVKQLRELGIEVEARVMSAHRTPEQAREFSVNAGRTASVSSSPPQARPRTWPGPSPRTPPFR